jgi:hypothetical protein
MPRYDPKRKKWIDDWFGGIDGPALTDAQIAQAKREAHYGQDLSNIAMHLPRNASPDVRAAVIADIQKGLQTQFYGSVGLPGEYVNKSKALGVAGISAAASNYASDRGVEQSRVAGSLGADITGRHSTEAAESEASSFLNYLQQKYKTPVSLTTGGEGSSRVATQTPALPSVSRGEVAPQKSFEELLTDKYRMQKKQREIEESIFGAEDIYTPGDWRRALKKKRIYKRVMEED